MPHSDSTQPLQPSDAPVSRRAFLGRAVAAIGVTGFLAACGGGDDAGTGGGDAAVTGGGAEGGSGEGLQAANCSGYDAMDEGALQMRTSLNYVDESAVAGQNCANCRFYNASAEMAPCGGCQLFAGPVTPDGHCTSWAEAVAS